MYRTNLWLRFCMHACFWLLAGAGVAADPDGPTVAIDNYDGPATVAVQELGNYRLRIELDPAGESKPLAVRVELPKTGRQAWPVIDVEVRDAEGRAISVRRSGIEWQRLLIPVPARRAVYLVQAVDPPPGQPPQLAEQGRQITDALTGLSLAVARWYGGRQAALSIRFDDSHPSHLAKAIPILREYGFRGTFMINPGGREPNSRRRSSFEDHLEQWQACARRGDQEFANHSAHHRGAVGDQDMEAEVGDAAKRIWELSPGKSKLAALNLGGGTVWETTRTLRYYLDKYCLFDASGNSTGMDDTYGNRVETFREMLKQHLERGIWYRTHYHDIGAGCASSEENFRAVLDIAKQHEASLWIAGMADIHKYQTERLASSLARVGSDSRRLTFTLFCSTDPELYDQPLTLEVAFPSSWPQDRIAIRQARDNAEVARRLSPSAKGVSYFDVAPRTAAFTIELHPSGSKEISTNHVAHNDP